MLTGNLFDFAIMKTSVISDEFRERYLSEPGTEGVFEARAIVFDGSDDYHHRINDPALEHRRELHPGDPRLGPARLAGLGRSRQHAAARRAAPARHHQPADARRRPPVGHVGQPLDPQRLARKRGGRRARRGCAPATRSASTSTPAAATRWSTTTRSRGARPKRRRRCRESNTPWEELYREKTGQLADGGSARVRGQISRHVSQDAAPQSLALMYGDLEGSGGKLRFVVKVRDRRVGPAITDPCYRLSIVREANARSDRDRIGEPAAILRRSAKLESKCADSAPGLQGPGNPP